MGVGTNFIVAVSPDGSFEEETCAFMIVPVSSADLSSLQEAEEDTEDAGAYYTVVHDGN